MKEIPVVATTSLTQTSLQCFIYSQKSQSERDRICERECDKIDRAFARDFKNVEKGGSLFERFRDNIFRK